MSSLSLLFKFVLSFPFHMVCACMCVGLCVHRCAHVCVYFPEFPPATNWEAVHYFRIVSNI